jgi:hypothetical protein
MNKLARIHQAASAVQTSGSRVGAFTPTASNPASSWRRQRVMAEALLQVVDANRRSYGELNTRHTAVSLRATARRGGRRR